MAKVIGPLQTSPHVSCTVDNDGYCDECGTSWCPAEKAENGEIAVCQIEPPHEGVHVGYTFSGKRVEWRK